MHLRWLGGAAHVAVSALTAALSDQDSVVRVEAAMTLDVFGVARPTSGDDP